MPGAKIITDADALIAALRVPPPEPNAPGLRAAVRGVRKSRRELARHVYEGGDRNGRGSGEYFVTYGGYRVARSAIDEALRRGLIVPAYPGLTDGTWTLPEEAESIRLAWEERQRKRGHA